LSEDVRKAKAFLGYGWMNQRARVRRSSNVRLGLAKGLRRCLDSTNVIEWPNSGIRSRARRVKNWRDHGMVVRWMAASLLDIEKRFKRIMGYQQLWMLEAKLKDLAEEASVDTKSQVV